MLVLLDADGIVYRAGFAAEDKEFHVVHQPPGEEYPTYIVFSRTSDKTALKNLRAWEETVDKEDIFDCEEVKIHEELEHVLATVKAILRDIKYSVAEQFDIEVDDVILRVLLSGPGNFRNDIATVAGYKANRKDDHKPYWYQQIRNYLTEWWDAEVIEGREADDECAIVQHQSSEDTIIATIDKDLDQVPGWHYDYGKKRFYYTKEDEGHLLFYKQVLSGDSTDNIPGCYKIGRVRADRIVDAAYLEYGMDHDKIWETIVGVYDESISTHGEACPYFQKACSEGVEAVVIEMARLVKMQEYVGQLWTPHDRPDEVLEMEFES